MISLQNSEFPFQVAARQILCAVSLLLVLSSASGVEFPPIVTEENLQDAIAGAGGFNQVDIADMDVNLDGALDVADLVYFLNGGGPTELIGYKWLVLASFKGPSEGLTSITYSYSFVLDIGEFSANSATIDEFDPTKGLLEQNISAPGQLPGANRPDYALSLTVPQNTVFSKSESSETATLVSDTVVIDFDDPTNPTGKPLNRSWTVVIDKTAVFDDTFDHGTIAERTSGFLPGGQELEATGTVTLVRYMPSQLLPLEMP